MSPPDRYEGRAYMAKQVVPLGTDYRIPEQGRIRLGVKTEQFAGSTGGVPAV